MNAPSDIKQDANRWLAEIEEHIKQFSPDYEPPQPQHTENTADCSNESIVFYNYEFYGLYRPWKSSRITRFFDVEGTPASGWWDTELRVQYAKDQRMEMCCANNPFEVNDYYLHAVEPVFDWPIYI